MDDLDMRGIELAENIYRKDLEWHEKIQLEAEIHRLQIAKFGKGTIPGKAGEVEGWNQRKTAELLNVDEGKIAKDLKLANIIEKMPFLKETCKSADEARKLITKAAERLERNYAAEQVMKKQAETPLDIQRRMLIDRFIIGDFIELVKNVESRSIQLIEMDPPFAIDLNTNKKITDISNLSMLDYHEIPKSEYLLKMDMFIAECYRVMAPDSWLICWFGPEPWFDSIYQLIRKHNFECTRMCGIWVKEGQAGQTKRADIHLANCYEMFFYARKGNATIKKQGRSNVFSYAPVISSDKDHPTEKPIELYMDILSTFAEPGQNVLVPFLGSGATLLAAENLGINAFGYEKASVRKDSFIIKVNNGKPGAYRSYR